MQNIDGFIAETDGNTVEIVGITGTDLECEGCDEKCDKLYETDDSVMLCKGCYDECAKECALLEK